MLAKFGVAETSVDQLLNKGAFQRRLRLFFKFIAQSGLVIAFRPRTPFTQSGIQNSVTFLITDHPNGLNCTASTDTTVR